MKKENKDAYIFVGISLVPTAGLSMMAAKSIFKERKKRKKIHAWELMNMECIRNSERRLVDVLQAEGQNERFWAVMKEEADFLEIVRNQPKY